MKYLSILRGINVSGQKKIKMADLKSLYENLGLSDVITYIQSGNVIFYSKKKNRKNLKDAIEKAIEEKYAFHVPVDIRTAKELETIVSRCPYEEAKIETNGTKILVTFLASIPSKERVDALLEHVKPPEKLLAKGSEVYLYCPNGYGKSKLSNTFLESKLGVSATTRNWKSVNALCELSVS